MALHFFKGSENTLWLFQQGAQLSKGCCDTSPCFSDLSPRVTIQMFSSTYHCQPYSYFLLDSRKSVCFPLTHTTSLSNTRQALSYTCTTTQQDCSGKTQLRCIQMQWICTGIIWYMGCYCRCWRIKKVCNLMFHLTGMVSSNGKM